MHDEKYYMKKAYQEALKAYLMDEVPIGAIIVKNDRIIAKAHNQKEKNQSAIAHAEILAIQKANKKLKSWHLDDCILYVTLEPCAMCAGAILQSRIKKVIYGAKSFQDCAIESVFELYKIKGFNHYPETFYFNQMIECSKIISDYFKTKR